MKKAICFSVFFVYFLSTDIAFGQSGDSIGNYVMLYSGKLIKCSFIEYQSPLIITESAKYHEDDVKLYKKENNLYANMRHLGVRKNTSTFLPAEKIGKVNIFKEYYMSGGEIKYVVLYYNKGYGALKKAKYKFMKDDLADNGESIKLIKKGRNKKIGMKTMGYLALAAIPLCIYQYELTNTGNKIIALEAIGALGMWITSAVLLKHQSDEIEQALDIYNAGS
jgi:hypothetical protein